MLGDSAGNRHEEAIGLLAEEFGEKFPGDGERDSSGERVVLKPLRQQTRNALQTSLAFARGLSIAAVLHFLARLAFACLPSYLQSRVRPTSTTQAQEKRHRTAFLDGMRGVASVAVFFCHYVYTCHDVFHGYGLEGKYHDILKLPFLRLIFDGNAMVSIFFVVSGYSLSYKPLKLRRNPSELLLALSSSAFRRAFRLFLPCVASTLVVVVLVQLGVYEWTRSLAYNEILLQNREPHPPRFENIFIQLYDWSWKFFRFFAPYTWDAAWSKIEYDTHLWTIPSEFRASLILFVTHLGVLQMRARFRIPTMFVLLWVSIYKDKSVLFLFFAGFLLADLDQIRLGSSSSHPILPKPSHSDPTGIDSSRRRRGWNAFWLFIFILGLYFCSQPTMQSESTPGWVFLSSLIPDQFHPKFIFWSTIGAPLIVLATTHAPFLQRIFDNRFSEYLGKISFALYLVHGTIVHTVGYLTMQFFWGITGIDTQLAKELGFGLSALCTIPAAFWAADVFWRAVDMPSVRVARYIESICFER